MAALVEGRSKEKLTLLCRLILAQCVGVLNELHRGIFTYFRLFFHSLSFSKNLTFREQGISCRKLHLTLKADKIVYCCFASDSCKNV